MRFMKTTLFFLLTALAFASPALAQEKAPVANKNFFTIDMLPLYYDFFDYRKEIRVEAGYARHFRKHWFISGQLDCGLFDDYTFTKYYDFFNQGSGYYYIKEDARVTGFHFLPSGNYFFWQSKAKQGQGMYCGAIMDVNYYRRKLDFFNSQTQTNHAEIVNQFKTGAGVSLGGRCYMGKHFFAEIRTSIFGKILFSTSDHSINAQKSINSQWTSKDNNFWWVTNLNLGYAF